MIKPFILMVSLVILTVSCASIDQPLIDIKLGDDISKVLLRDNYDAIAKILNHDWNKVIGQYNPKITVDLKNDFVNVFWLTIPELNVQPIYATIARPIPIANVEKLKSAIAARQTSDNINKKN